MSAVLQPESISSMIGAITFYVKGRCKGDAAIPFDSSGNENPNVLTAFLAFGGVRCPRLFHHVLHQRLAEFNQLRHLVSQVLPLESDLRLEMEDRPGQCHHVGGGFP